VPTLLNNLFDFGEYQMLIAGVLLCLTAVLNPDGMTKEMGAGLTKLRLLLLRRVNRRPAAPAVDTAPAGPPKVAGR
jgi:hypothetical protein